MVGSSSYSCLSTRIINMNIILWGGFGGTNLGDDLILFATLRDFLRINPQVKVKYLVSGEEFTPLQISDSFPMATPIKYTTSNRLKSFSSRSVLIVPGGQVIDQENKFFPLGRLAIDCFLSFILSRNSPILLSIGVRSIIDNYLHRAYLSIIRLTTKDFHVRDNIGKENLRKTLDSTEVDFLLDPVLSCDLLWNKKVFKEGADEISILLVQGNEGSRHSQSMTLEELGSYTNKFDTTQLVDVLQHDRRLDLNADQIKLVNAITKDVKYCETIKDVVRSYNSHTHVFTNRLHAAILGLISGCAVYLDKGHKKLNAILKMDIPLASFEKKGVTFYYFDETSWSRVEQLKEMRDEKLKRVLS